MGEDRIDNLVRLKSQVKLILMTFPCPLHKYPIMSVPFELSDQVPRFRVLYPLSPCFEPNESHRQESKAVSTKYAILPQIEPLHRAGPSNSPALAPAFIAAEVGLAPAAARHSLPQALLANHLIRVCTKRTQQCLRAELALPPIASSRFRPNRSQQELVCPGPDGASSRLGRRRSFLDVPVLGRGCAPEQQVCFNRCRNHHFH